jgi:ABC-2 type transport system permease protein
VTQRELGVLKRRRATPVPAWVLIAGRALVAVGTSLVLVSALIVVGRVLFGVRVPTSTLPGVAVASIVGALSFACLAFAVSAFIANADAAQPVLQAITLPLYFISGVFIPDANNPDWLRSIANVFPIRHLSQALLLAYDPATHGPGIAWGQLAAVAVWGVAGLIVALRRFRWTPANR